MTVQWSSKLSEAKFAPTTSANFSRSDSFNSLLLSLQERKKEKFIEGQ